jgi:hypothetical protein
MAKWVFDSQEDLPISHESIASVTLYPGIGLLGLLACGRRRNRRRV